MRKWIGMICVLLGAACLLSALGITINNRWENKNAEAVSQALLENVQSILEEKQPQPLLPDDAELPSDHTETLPDDKETLPDDTDKVPSEMPTVPVGGYDCIGILSIPALGLRLPVLADWSYEKLNHAPCHYYGTYYQGDFVIAAHNYESHFGRLPELQAGDIIVFTDVTGADHYYEVALLETLAMEATLEMITSGFALSLYTCTTGGSSRVTVRCNTIN